MYQTVIITQKGNLDILFFSMLKSFREQCDSCNCAGLVNSAPCWPL